MHQDIWNACECLQEAAETVRAAVATLLSQLTKQPLHGPRIVLLLNRLLPPGLVAAIEVPGPLLLLVSLKIFWCQLTLGKPAELLITDSEVI